MENKSGKIIAIVALAIAVVALSVGFAAFADQLTISGTATVEKAADAFASGVLLEQKSYEQFVKKGSFSYMSIREYAQTQSVPPYVVIGRLQKEEVIPWTWHQKYKLRYKWAEA